MLCPLCQIRHIQFQWSSFSFISLPISKFCKLVHLLIWKLRRYTYICFLDETKGNLSCKTWRINKADFFEINAHCNLLVLLLYKKCIIITSQCRPCNVISILFILLWIFLYGSLFIRNKFSCFLISLFIIFFVSNF